MRRVSRSLIMALVMILGLFGVPAVSAQEDTGSIEVHVSGCPDDYDAAAKFETCHANGITGDQLILDGPVYLTGVTAGSIGAVLWEGLPAGTYTIAEAVMTGDYASYEVYCSANDGEVVIPVEYRGNGRAAVMIELPEGAAVVCDWYNIPAQTVPAAPTVVPTQVPSEAVTPAPTSPVVTLPSTGSGAAGSGTGRIVMAILTGAAATSLLTGAALAQRAYASRRVR